MSEFETLENTEMFTPTPSVVIKNKRRKLTSSIWHNFTVVDEVLKVSSCDLCGMQMSYRTTVSNMRKHLMRRHQINDRKGSFSPATFKVSYRLGMLIETISKVKKMKVKNW